MMVFSSNWMILFPVAFTLFVGMRLARGSVDHGRSSWGVLLLQCTIAVLFLFSILAVGMRGNPLSAVWIMLLAAFTFVLFWKNRRIERSALLFAAMDADNLPQQQRLTSYFYEENTGWIRRKANGLRRDLAAGIPWARALEQRGIAKGIYERLALRLQTMYGKQEHAQLESKSGQMLSPLQIEAEAGRLLGRLMVFSWIILVVPFLALIFIVVIPTLAEMFAEFNIALPNVMRTAIQLADAANQYGLTHLAGIIPFVLFALVAFGFMVWLFPSLTGLPLLRWFTSGYHDNAGFAAFSQVIEHEKDLIQSCRVTADLIPSNHLARRFAAATILLEQGADPGTAFLNSRLISRKELRAFGRGIESRDPTWGLQQLAAWKTQRMLGRYSLIVQCLVVFQTIAAALLVGLVATGVIQALSALILEMEATW